LFCFVYFLSTVNKAKSAAKATKGGVQNSERNIRTRSKFYRPKTLKLARNPKYARKSVASRPSLDKYNIIRYPLATESAMKQIEDNNTLTFIVDIRSNKRQIKAAVKELYEVDTVKVNTLIR